MGEQYRSVMIHCADGRVLTGRYYPALQKNDGYSYIIGDNGELFVIPAGNCLNEPIPNVKSEVHDIASLLERISDSQSDEFDIVGTEEISALDIIAEVAEALRTHEGLVYYTHEQHQDRDEILIILKKNSDEEESV